MKRIDRKILIITSVFCLAPIVLGLALYSALPENIAVHFNLKGAPDGYFSKAGFVFGAPVVMALLQAFACVISDLTDKNKEANKKASTVFKWIIPSISIVAYVVTALNALGKSVDIRRIVMLIIGVLFIVVGNYLPKTIGNCHITLMRKLDDNTAKRTLRITGRVMIADGALFVVGVLFNSFVSLALIALVAAETLALGVYSFVKSVK